METKDKGMVACLQRLFWLMCMCLACIEIGFAEDLYKPINIDMKQGLSNVFVNDMAIDNQGFLWIATEGGLNRIAGNKCTVFNVNNSDISSDELVDLYYDKTGNSLWIRFKNGKVDILDCRTLSFKHFSNHKTMIKDGISSISGATSGGVWVAYNHGDIQYYNPKTQSFVTYSKKLFPKNKHGIRCIKDDGKGRIYIGLRSDGMYVYNRKTRKAKHFAHNKKNKQGLPGNKVNSIYIDHNNNLWIGTNMGLALFNEGTDCFRVLQHQDNDKNSIAGDNIFQITETDYHELWILSATCGISVLDLKMYRQPFYENLSFQHITKGNSGLASDNTRKVIQDSFNNIWIGYFGSGIDFISKSSPHFKTLYYNDKPITNTFGIYCDRQDCLWIVQDNIIKRYHHGQTVDNWNFSSHIFNAPATVYSIIQDHKGHMWFGTCDNGIFEFDTHTKQFTHYLRIQGTDAHALCESRDGTILAGTETGIYSIKDRVERKETMLNKLMGKTHTHIFSIIEDNTGQLWIGTVGKGVFVFDKERKLIAHMNEKNLLRSNSASQIFKDSQGGIWIATFNGLAYVKSPKNLKSVKIYNERQGLKGNHICAICQDKKGNIWVSTSLGIACLNIHNQRFYNYGFQYGIPKGNFVEAAAAVTLDGTLYFSSTSGVCYFNPQLMLKQKKMSQVEIIGCEEVGRINEQNYQLVSPADDGSIQLKCNDNTFRICFTTRNFAEKEDVEYFYMMKGLDKQWSETNGETEVTFKNLKPGKYTFFVKAKLKDQDWKEASVAELKVVVIPPFWLTWWAKSGYAIAILGLVIYILRLYKKRQRSKNSLIQTDFGSIQKQDISEKTANGAEILNERGNTETENDSKPELQMQQLSETDKQFLEKLNGIIAEHIGKEELNIPFISKEIAMSHSTFYRKVKTITGLSANEYIKKAKLDKSMRLLASREHSIADVARLSGFNNLSSFRTNFKNEFGIAPSDVRNDDN